jgi:predicted AlkP superfamily pyrophosphatase or phosphodiesterase
MILGQQRRMLSSIRLVLAATLLGSLAGCTDTIPPPRTASASAFPADVRAPVTILISIDGFRADYLARGVTPNLSALAAGGLSAAMWPSFPSKTFPNHWTLVTGLVPDHHGIVSNNMEDPARPGEKFSMETDDPFWWNAAEPIWVEADKAGIRTATMFWPGANVATGGSKEMTGFKTVTGGTRPDDWQQFNLAIPSHQRIETLLDWMRRPADIRPKFVTAYFDTVDTAGHHFGPDAHETIAALGELDVEIGRLVSGVRALGQPVNFVIVADHGMAGIDNARSIPVTALADPADGRSFETGPFASFYSVPGHEKALEASLLKPHNHVQCWRKGEIPARFRYGTNARIPPYFCLSETGWSVVARPLEDRGTHGYDNRAPEMAALFIANGPAFPKAAKLAPFDNVDVAPLLRVLLKLPAKQGDGDDAPFRGLVEP